MQNAPRWTKPYFGVTHYPLDFAYATVSDHRSFAVAGWGLKPTKSTRGLGMYGHTGYQLTMFEQTFFAKDHDDYLAAAKQWIEESTKGVQHASTGPGDHHTATASVRPA